MIVRVWHARAALAPPSAYPRHFIDAVLPKLHRIEGFVGATLLRQHRAHDIEFVVETRWTSMDAVRAFAGANIDRAVVAPDAAAMLIDYDQRVHHYEVVYET
jgi:heme-degrading monooxygenase HmoA